MDKEIAAVLQEGESMLWTGKPPVCSIKDAAYKKGFLINCVIGLAIAVVLAVAYILMMHGQPINVFVIIVILVLAFISPYGSIRDANEMNKKVVYILTDKRIIVKVKDRINEIGYSAVRDAAVREDSDGRISLLCGKAAMASPEWKWRGIALKEPETDEETGACTKFAVYAISEADRVKGILRAYIPITK